jgi:hypothetical protein
MVTILEDQQQTLARMEADMIEAGAAGDVSKMVALAGTFAKARDAVMKSQKEANAAKISAAEGVLITGIRTVVENVNWGEIAGEDIHTVIFYLDKSTEPPVYTIQVNPKKRFKASGTSTGPVLRKVGTIMHRLANGDEIEHRTIKEIVQTYANSEVASHSLFDKGAWAILFARVNKSLDVQFEDCNCKAPIPIEPTV